MNKLNLICLRIMKSKKLRLLPIIIGLTSLLLIWSLKNRECRSVVRKCHFETTENDLPYFVGPVERSNAFDVVQLLNRVIKGYIKGYSENVPKDDARNIYFYETSCRGDLTPRQACAIESAARTHPEWIVNVLFSGPVSLSQFTRGPSVLSYAIFPNVKFARVFIRNYVKNTLLESLVLDGSLNRSKNLYSHLSEIIHVTTLYKHSGVYLDLDALVARPLDDLGDNFVVMDSHRAVSGAVLGLGSDGAGRHLGQIAAHEVNVTYAADDCEFTVADALTRVLRRLCHPLLLNQTCQGVHVYGPEIIQSSETIPKQGNAYLYYAGRANFDQHWKLAEKYCPTVFKAFTSEFK